MISPRTRTWPNAFSMVRLSAPESSVTVSAGELSPGATFANRPALVSSGSSMNILLLGSGGREDALAWRLRQSPSCDRLVAAPGNPGIARWAECVAIDPCDADAVVQFARGNAIDLVVIGPEAPLVAGVGEGDTGPNTGGMGAYAPAPVLTAELQQRAMDEIVRPTARALAEAGTPFSGVLYAGLMLTASGPRLIEYNVRFGDPECEAIMPLIDGDFAELLHAVAAGRLQDVEPALTGKHAVTVVVAARGYPGTPACGGLIR